MDPYKLFLCSASEDYSLCDELRGHLALLEHQGHIEIVDDRDIQVGKDGDTQRIDRVRQSSIFLLMLSPALMRDLRRNVCVKEALDRHVDEALLLIPVLLRPTDWKEYSFGNLVSLPRDGRAITENRAGPAARDTCWLGIAKEIRALVTKLRAEGTQVPTKVEPKVELVSGAPKGPHLPQGRFRQGHALIIGTGDPGIEVTERDAQGLHSLLIDDSKAGYPKEQAKLLVRAAATRQNILDELDKLAARVEKDPDRDTTVLIYFSGHGLRSDGENATYYLIPHGYRIGAEATTAISGGEFSDRISAIKARKLMVFLDCCHAAGVPKTPGFKPAAIPPDLESRLGRGSGVVIVASSRDDEKSYTGTPYSVFTACLIEALEGRGSSENYACILDVVAYLMRHVPNRQPNQHPMIKKMLDLGENWPICYHGHATGTAVPSPLPSPTGGKAPVVDRQLRRSLERELTGLRETEALYSEKLTRLRRAKATAVDVTVQFKYEQDIIDAEKELATMERKIDELCDRLNS
jgi:hypothetical protein